MIDLTPHRDTFFVRLLLEVRGKKIPILLRFFVQYDLISPALIIFLFFLTEVLLLWLSMEHFSI